MRKVPVILTTFALTLGGILFGLTAQRPAAHAAPPAKPVASAVGQPTATLADLLTGKLYPSTLKRDQIGPDYHYVTVIDGQGKPASCATKGETLALAGETFLVAYLLPDAPARPTGAADAAPTLPDAQLTLLNMRYVQAMSGIRDTPPPPPTPSTTTAPRMAAP